MNLQKSGRFDLKQLFLSNIHKFGNWLLQYSPNALFHSKCRYPLVRKVARADEWGGLESRCGLRVTVGSNPTPSASFKRPSRDVVELQSVLLHQLYGEAIQ